MILEVESARLVPENFRAELMRWLIDGYNVMHAGGRLRPNLSRSGFRNARRRFLDELLLAMGPHRARSTTVVFDASVHPGDFDLSDNYQGLSILFALGDESADARIEALIASDSDPKALSVVSSDRRIRQAASRRKSKSITAEVFWEWIDELKDRVRRAQARIPVPKPGTVRPKSKPAAEEPSWLEEFGAIEEIADLDRTLNPHDALLTDADVAEIEREVEREP
jgi:predicted RNA-binding protein with PIN domain